MDFLHCVTKEELGEAFLPHTKTEVDTPSRKSARAVQQQSIYSLGDMMSRSGSNRDKPAAPGSVVLIYQALS